MNLKDKVAVVTGGAQGIGKEIALTLAQAGANIVICDVNSETLEKTKQEIENLGSKVLTFVVDVTVPEQVDNMISGVVKEFNRVDILVNNAGITRDGLVMRMKESDWDLVLDINLKGAFNCLKAVTRPMMKQRYGKIINISSVVGIMGNPGQVNYCASKAGMIGLTKSAAKELGTRGITVNAVAPGFIRTPMTDQLTDEQKQQIFSQIPQGKLGEAQDIANLVLFLSSNLSDYITGEVVRVDGGMAM